MKSLRQEREGSAPAAEAQHSLLAEVHQWCDSYLVDQEQAVSSQLQRIVSEQNEILASIGVDEEALAVAELQAFLELVEVDETKLQAGFDNELLALLKGVRRMDVISLRTSADNRVRDENFRKMLISMIDDVRVVLIRLAVQVRRLRMAKSDLDSDECAALGRETLEVFAPLANRLGIWQLKWELEDYAFRYLHNDIYKDLARRLAERRVDREQYIEDFTGELRQILATADIRGEVLGRPKHIYSIYKKMSKKMLEFENIKDVRAVRILVDTVGDCYAVLGLVHTTWPHVPGEFDDYIATPKENGYKSIHTAVIGPQGKLVEVQIRTHEMHQENELGIAAHWRYKENSRHDASMDVKILWLRQLLEWKEEVGEGSELFEQFRNLTDDERVYVFTPKGKVVDLPAGSTPLDFAYSIHTHVGHQCRGAKVNGRIVPLTHRLSTGEQVEVLTQRNGQPSRDWLNASAGYIHTQKARSRIQRWFKEEDYDHNAAAGRSSLDRELYRLGVGEVSLEKLAAECGYKSTDAFFAAIGSGDLKVSQAVSSLRNTVSGRSSKGFGSSLPRSGESQSGMEVQGVGNLLTQFASCCNPLPGDEIVGYITQSRGISIHRSDCGNILRLDEEKKDRLIQVNWGGITSETFAVNIEVIAIDRKNLLYDVSRIFSDADVNVVSTATNTDNRENKARMNIRLEVSDVEALSHVLNRISMVPNVLDVRRVLS